MGQSDPSGPAEVRLCRLGRGEIEHPRRRQGQLRTYRLDGPVRCRVVVLPNLLAPQRRMDRRNLRADGYPLRESARCWTCSVATLLPAALAGVRPQQLQSLAMAARQRTSPAVGRLALLGSFPPLCGSVAPITDWAHYADPMLAPMRRSQIGQLGQRPKLGRPVGVDARRPTRQGVTEFDGKF